MKKQTGHTLIEMSIVIAVLSVILTVGVGVIHGLLRAGGAARNALAEQMTLGRLAETFRDDVHASGDFHEVAAAENDSRPTAWELEQADGATVVYRLEEGRLVRSGKTPAGATHESFDLAENATVAIEEQLEGRIERRLGLADIAKEGEIDFLGTRERVPDEEVKTRGVHIMAGFSMPVGG